MRFVFKVYSFTGDTNLDKVHEDVSEALHVISPALLDAEMGIDARVPSGACKRTFYVNSTKNQVKIL